MNVIDEVWKRVLICLAFGGVLATVIAKMTNRKVEISALFLAVLLYFFLTNVNRKNQRNKEEGSNN